MIIATRMILIMKRILEVFLKIKRFGSTSFMIKGKVMYQRRLYLMTVTSDHMPKMIHGDDTSGCYKNWPVMIGGHR